MHIQQLQLDRIGQHRDVAVDHLEPGFNLIYGATGTGKSALLDSVRALLFGQQHGVVDDVDTTTSITVASAGERHRISRRWADGGVGVLSAQPLDQSRDRAAESLLPQLSQRLYDKVMHIAFQRGYDIHGAVEEAEAILGRHTQPTYEIHELERRLSDLESRRAEWLRSDNGASPLDEAARRRERLVAEIEELETRHARSHTAQQRRRGELQQLITVSEGSLADVSRQADGVDAEIQEIDEEHQQLLKQYEELQRTTDAELSGELQAKLKKITEQMLRWNRVLADVIERRDRIRGELVEWATGDGRAELGGPAKRIADMEHLISQLRAEISVFRSDRAAAPNCGCRDLHDDCRNQLNELRDHLYELCEDLSRQQYKFRRNAMNTELKQLRRCHGEVTQYLQRLVKRRNQLLRRLGEADPCALSRVIREQSELCEVEDNDALFDLVSIKSFDFASDWEAVQRRLGEIDYQLEELRARRVELHREGETHRQQLGQLRAELEGLGVREQVDIELQQKREQLERLDADHAALMRQWREINDAIHNLSRELDALRASHRRVDVLIDASPFLSELTLGEFTSVRRSPQSGRVVLDGRNGNTYAWEAVDHEARDMAQLAVCLAAANRLHQAGLTCPLFVDDLFAHVAEAHVPHVARVLERFGAAGRQLIATTDWEAASLRCESQGVRVRRVSRAPIPVAPTRHDATHHNVEPVVQAPLAPPAPEPTVAQPVAQTAATLRSVEAVDHEPATQPTFGDGIPDDTYYLERTDPIEEAPDLEHETAVALRTHGVHTIGDLLAVTGENLAAWSDVRLSSQQLRHCQSNCCLLCDVINLRPYDVRILVGAGIHDAQQLRAMTSEQLLSRVEAYIRTNEGRAILVSGDDFELARVANWIRSARESREFHRESERQQALRRSKQANRSGSGLSVFSGRGGQPRRFEPRDGRTTRRASETSSRQAQAADTSRGERDGKRETTRSTQAERADKTRSAKSETASSGSTSGSSKLRFHLERSSDVEAAPSIGPKMAEHLAKIQVISVGDLLDRDAEEISDQLDHRRVNPDTVRLWQRQAEWCCRVPEIRGHDAQLLVACGYENVEDLAGVDSDELFGAVQQIVDTKEGRRILRGGTKPDLAEVKDWLEWTKHSRQLRAA